MPPSPKNLFKKFLSGTPTAKEKAEPTLNSGSPGELGPVTIENWEMPLSKELGPDTYFVATNAAEKLFGEYLIDKKLVEADALAEALLEQMASLPSIPELAFRSKLLSAKDLIRVLSYQTKFRLEFRRACQELGLWTDELEKLLTEATHRSKTPVGQLLAKRKGVSLQRLARAYELYSQEVGSNAQLDSGFHLIEANLLKCYTDLFNEEYRYSLQQIVGSFTESVHAGQGDEGMEDSLVLLQQCVRELKAMAGFIRANLSEEILRSLETTVRICARNHKSLLNNEAQQLASLAGQTIDCAWEIRNQLFQSCSEENYWTTSQKTFQERKEALETFSETIRTRLLSGKKVA